MKLIDCIRALMAASLFMLAPLGMCQTYVGVSSSGNAKVSPGLIETTTWRNSSGAPATIVLVGEIQTNSGGKIDGRDALGSPKTITVAAGGTFTTTYRRSEMANVTTEESWSIESFTTQKQNEPPSASISGPSSLSTVESGSISFSASDADGNLARWRFYKSTNSNPQWSSASGSSAGPGSYSVSGSGLGVGSHTFYVEAEDSSGASSSDSLTISVYQKETYYYLTVSAGSGGTASGSATGLSGTATRSISASPDSTHDFDRWSGDTVANSSAKTTTISMGNKNRSVTALFKAKTTGGSGDTGGSTPTKSSQSAVTITPASKTITVGDSVSFTASGGSGTGAYVWSGASGSGTSASKIFTSAGTFTVSVYKAGDTNYNQSNTATSTITVVNGSSDGGEDTGGGTTKSGQSLVTITPPTKTITVGDSVSFTASGGSGTGAYVWSEASGSGTSASKTFTSTGTFTVSVYRAGDSNYNQSNTASSTITVNAVPIPTGPVTVDFSLPAQIVRPKTGSLSQSITFTATSSNGTLTEYQWSASVSNGASLGSSSWTAFQATTKDVYVDSGYNTQVEHQEVVSGGYWTPDGGPVDFDLLRTWQARGTPMVTFTAPDGVTSGLYPDYNIDLHWRYVDPVYRTTYTDEWVDTSHWTTQTVPVQLATGTVTKTLSIGTTTPLGTCTVTFTARDASGRTATLTRTTEIVDQRKSQTVTITPPTATIDAGDSATFTAAGGNTTYVWSGVAGSGAAASAVFAQAGTYTVSVYAASNAEYEQSNVATATVTVNPLPSATLSATPTAPFYPGAVALAWTTANAESATLSGPGFTGAPSVTPGVGSTASTTLPAGGHTWILTATSKSGKTVSATASATIGRGAQTVVLTPPLSNIAAGESVTFTAAGGLNGYIWGDTASGSGTNKTITFPDTGSFVVSVFSPESANYDASNVATANITVTRPTSGVRVQPKDSEVLINTPTNKNSQIVIETDK